MPALDLVKLRDAAIAGIRAALPWLAEVRDYRGEFVAAEIQRVSLNVPCVLIDFDAVPKWSFAGTGEWDVEAHYVAYVVSSPLEGQDALEIAQAVALVIAGQRWGLQAPDGRISSAQIERVANRYTIPADEAGITIYSVHWRQPLRLGTPDPQDGPAVTPVAVYLGQAPAIGTGHEPDYVQVAP